MYTPLKVTTDYSLLKSLIKIKDLVNFCVNNNINSCAICDTNLFGVIEFYKTCKQNNIKPIIALEIIINDYNIYLYAENYNGYKNLLQINNIINERNISILELKNYSNDILLIIPFKSIKIANDLNFFQHIYFGYENSDELKNLLVKSNNVVYVNDIKAFKLTDLEYLKYLDIIAGRIDEKYLNNYFNYDKLTKFDLEKIDEVVKLLNVEIPFGKRYIPKYKEDIDSYQFLTNLAIKGLKKRLNKEVPPEYIKRLKYELSVINKMGFVDYFLIVYDYVLYAKKHDILVGPGRGSAAGSLVSYVIGITDIDPLKYNLLFERFLNYERVTMPDIDIDFDNTKRDEVIAYVKEKYGAENVSGGITFATFKTKLVLREVSKIFKIEEILLNKFLKVIDRDLSLKDNLKIKNVVAYLNSYPDLKKVYQVAMNLEGLKKNISTHAAGIVIGDRPLYEIIPMYKNEDVYLTGVTMEYLEDLGLLKMDFLALKNLSTISNILKNIPNLKLSDIPLDDPKVYDLFCTANTDGIFQFETNAFKSMLTKYKPHNFNELVASIALVRPGPSQELETYIKRKEGQESVKYYHESLKDILIDSYGVIVYQEQVISILVKMASFSYAEADNIRRAMAKKKSDILLSVKDDFILRSVKNGYSREIAENIYNHILKFASYGFNKAHSVSYAIISYQMAYLKVHYHSLFIFELLDSDNHDTYKLRLYLNELKNENLKINNVDINFSQNKFVLKNNIVYLPFNLIKNFKTDIINYLIEERNKNGYFTDIYDFFKRTVNKLTINDYLLLIKAGALNDLNINNKTLINNLEAFINYGKLYADLGEYALMPEIKKEDEYSDDIIRENEINSYGFYITNHPTSKYINKDIMKIINIKENVFKNVICYVMVENVKKIKTKKGEEMAFLSGSDETGLADFTMFPDVYKKYKNIVKNDIVKIRGKVSKRYDKYSIIINEMSKE